MSELQSLSLQNWRKFENLSVNFSQGINFLLGSNGTGKTSIIEAIFFLAQRKSFRTSKNSELIRTGQSAAYILAQFESSGQTHSLGLKISRIDPLTLTIDQQAQKKISILNSILSCVIFTFSDLEIVQGQPSKRREVFDQLLSARDSHYAQLTRDYKKILESRAKILNNLSKSRYYSNPTSELNFANQQLVNIGSEIILARLNNFNWLEEMINRYYAFFTDSPHKIQLDYQPSFLLKGESLEEIQSQFHQVLEFNQRVEIQSARNLFGPQRDDIQILYSGNSTRQLFSLGEQWSLAISLRLAQTQILKESTSFTPVVLLDDVFSIIDNTRAERLINQLNNFGQVFLTTAREPNLPIPNSNKIELQ
jgi:DNA replication and repair protein RecF